VVAPPNHLYYGDNLGILRDRIGTESVDLIYLDPPFNSNATYNVLFRSHTGEAASAQIQAFDDTWHWSQQTEKLFLSMIGGGSHPRVADALAAMRNLLGTSDVNAYLVMMTARLVELHRVLKSTGSLYLHCDPTASHYLKIVLDAIFEPTNFRNEIVWRRTSTVKGNAGQGAKHFGRNADTILFYSKDASYIFNPPRVAYSDEYIRSKFSYVEPETGRRFQTVSMSGPGGAAKGNPEYEVLGVTRHWRFSRAEMQRLIDENKVYQGRPGDVPRQKYYLDESQGVEVQSLWTDIDSINSQAAERLGYPTQKPLALLERIIAASSSPDDVVLDPFCGCGTTIDAAEKLHRRWIGIDVTYLAIDLIRKRLRHTYGDEIENTYAVHGVPADLDGAAALFAENPFDFERWAVSLIDAQPNEKQRGDKGIDGRVRFYADEDRIGQALVSVKGGKTVNPAMVNEINGTVAREQAEMGILITLTEPTPGMRRTAELSGSYTATLTGQTYPKIQIVSVRDLMTGNGPNMPTAILPYLKAPQSRRTAPGGPDQLTLDT
jgi:DNA modification methylase